MREAQGGGAFLDLHPFVLEALLVTYDKVVPQKLNNWLFRFFASYSSLLQTRGA